MNLLNRVLAYAAAHMLKGVEQPMDTLELNKADTGTSAPGAASVAGAQQPSILAEAENLGSRIIGEVKSVFSAVETDALAVIGKLGHAHTTLSGLSIEAAIAGEVAVVKTAIENALVAIAKHVGG